MNEKARDAMSDRALKTVPFPARFHWTHWFGAAVILFIVAMTAFTVIDTAGLESHQGSAVVLQKRVIPSHPTYQRQLVGKTHLVRTVTVPEQYQIELKVGDLEMKTNVEKSLYDQLKLGDPLQVTYQKPRLTGSPLVTSVSK